MFAKLAWLENIVLQGLAVVQTARWVRGAALLGLPPLQVAQIVV
jgi:hypothetical protein